MTERPVRKSIRLPGYDYAGPGSLFFTFCTKDRGEYFGSVRDGAIVLNEFGDLVWAEWMRTLEIRTELLAHAFVVMPNHVHGLIRLAPSPETAVPPLPNEIDLPLHARKRPHSLSTMATGFKGAVTRGIRASLGDNDHDVWQRNFYEHVIRDEKDFDSVYAYILENPQRWHEDRFNPNRPNM